VLRIQVRVPVPSLNARDVDAWVAVDEWAGKP
jgi:hypothetical protein